MKLMVLLLLLSLPMFALESADTLPAGVEHWTAARLDAMHRQLVSKAASDPGHAASENLAELTNDRYMLAQRADTGGPEWHATEADVFVVRSGSATLIVGGDLHDAKVIAPNEKRGGTISGGTRLQISVGDVVRIPTRTPHQILPDDSHDFSYFVIKVKD